MGIMDFELLDQRYGITLHPPEPEAIVIPIAELLQASRMEEFLNHYRSQLRAENRKPAAAFTAGFFGDVAMALQYTISVPGSAPDFSLDNLELQMTTGNKRPEITFRPLRWQEREGPDGGLPRRQWLTEVLSGFYGGQARPFMESLSAASGLHISQLWGQLPTRFYRDIHGLLQEEQEERTKIRITGDYRFLCEELDAAAVFGRSRNPFAAVIRTVEPLIDPNRLTAVKTACCLNYLTEDHGYCYTCPRLTEEQRATQAENYRARH
ncbi:(2Fe-2S)-binding protein [Paenibacillus sp. BAC0078]